MRAFPNFLIYIMLQSIIQGAVTRYPASMSSSFEYVEKIRYWRRHSTLAIRIVSVLWMYLLWAKLWLWENHYIQFEEEAYFRFSYTYYVCTFLHVWTPLISDLYIRWLIKLIVSYETNISFWLFSIISLSLTIYGYLLTTTFH